MYRLYVFGGRGHFYFNFFGIHRSTTGPIGARPRVRPLGSPPPPRIMILWKSIESTGTYINKHIHYVFVDLHVYSIIHRYLESNRIVSYLFSLVLIHPVSVYSAHLICYLVSVNQSYNWAVSDSLLQTALASTCMYTQYTSQSQEKKNNCLTGRLYRLLFKKRKYVTNEIIDKTL